MHFSPPFPPTTTAIPFTPRLFPLRRRRQPLPERPSPSSPPPLSRGTREAHNPFEEEEEEDGDYAGGGRGGGRGGERIYQEISEAK